jgi:hypothetical protein
MSTLEKVRKAKKIVDMLNCPKNNKGDFNIFRAKRFYTNAGGNICIVVRVGEETYYQEYLGYRPLKATYTPYRG